MKMGIVQHEGLCYDVVAEIEPGSLHNLFAVEAGAWAHQRVPLVVFGWDGIDILVVFPRAWLLFHLPIFGEELLRGRTPFLRLLREALAAVFAELFHVIYAVPEPLAVHGIQFLSLRRLLPRDLAPAAIQIEGDEADGFPDPFEVDRAVPELGRDPDDGGLRHGDLFHMTGIVAQPYLHLRIEGLEEMLQIRAGEEKILVLRVVHVRFFHHVLVVGDGESEVDGGLGVHFRARIPAARGDIVLPVVMLYGHRIDEPVVFTHKRFLLLPLIRIRYLPIRMNVHLLSGQTDSRLLFVHMLIYMEPAAIDIEMGVSPSQSQNIRSYVHCCHSPPSSVFTASFL